MAKSFYLWQCDQDWTECNHRGQWVVMFSVHRMAAGILSRNVLDQDEQTTYSMNDRWETSDECITDIIFLHVRFVYLYSAMEVLLLLAVLLPFLCEEPAVVSWFACRTIKEGTYFYKTLYISERDILILSSSPIDISTYSVQDYYLCYLKVQLCHLLTSQAVIICSSP